MRLLLAAALALGLSAAARAAGPAASNWPMEGADAQHTNASKLPGPGLPRRAWKKSIPAPTNNTGISLDGQGDFYVMISTGIYAFHPDGTVKWTRAFGSSPQQTAVGDNGLIYVSSQVYGPNAAQIMALSTATGNIAWMTNVTNGDGDGGHFLLDPAGNIYHGNGGAACCTGHHYASLQPNGTLRWNNTIGSSSSGGYLTLSTIPARGIVTGEASSPGNYRIIVSSNGDVDSTPQTNSYPQTAAAVAPNNVAYSYFNASGDHLQALGPTGTVLWTKSDVTADKSFQPLVQGTTRVYMIDTGSPPSLYAVDAANGNTVWTSTLAWVGGVTSGSSIKTGVVDLNSNRVYLPVCRAYSNAGFPDRDGRLLGIDASNGSVLWNLPVVPRNGGGAGGSCSIGQPVIDQGKVLYLWHNEDGSQSYFVSRFEDTNVSSLSLSVDTGTLIPQGVVTFTAQVSPSTSGILVELALSSNPVSILTVTPSSFTQPTDATGRAVFTMRASAQVSQGNDVSDFMEIATATAFGFQSVKQVFIESNRLDHYSSSSPASVPVGTNFVFSVFARNSYNHTTYKGETINMVPIHDGSDDVGGSGSLFVNQAVVPTAGVNAGTLTLTNQNYNRTENIQIKISGTTSGTTGYSDTIIIRGPDTFEVSVPSTATALTPFQVHVIAKDLTTGATVFGYSGNLSLSAISPTGSNPTAPASGQLGVNNINIQGGIGNLVTQSYNKADRIKIVALDSALGVSGISNFVTVSSVTSPIDHYFIVSPSSVSVGLPFTFQVLARDISDNATSYTRGPTTLSVFAVLASTNLPAPGSLNSPSVTLQPGATYLALNSQSYNRVETIQLKVVDQNNKVGLSSPIQIKGPTYFDIVVPTVTVQVSENFRVLAIARNENGEQVVGYNSSVNLAAVRAASTGTAGGGSLGLTSLSFSGGFASTDFESYSKGEGIRIHIIDSTLGVHTYSSSFTVTAPADSTDHYIVTVPTQVTVGLGFPMTAAAVNASSASVTYSLDKDLTYTTVLSNTSSAGSGSLGTASGSLAQNTSTATIASQTYNRTETIQIRVTDSNGKTGLSDSMLVSGPESFSVSVPTYTVNAGDFFRVIVTALDKGGSQVLGYNGTVSLSAIQSGDTSTAASGTLGLTSLTLGGGLASTDFESFSKGAGLRIRATDSSLNVTSFSSSFTVTAPADATDHYSFSVPTRVTVGVPFSMDIGAFNASSAPVAYSLAKGLTLTTILDGTSVAGSGSLGQSAVTLAASASTASLSAQTYNRIETVRFRVTDDAGRTGLSGPVEFAGPSSFGLTVPAGPVAAGAAFSMLIVARDDGGSQVTGYNATVNISAVQAGDTSAAASGVLSFTSLSIGAGQGNTAFQSYSKGGDIRLKVTDTSLNVVSYSSSFTVTAPADSTRHYVVTAPASATVGLPFSLQAASVDASSAAATYSLPKTLTYTVRLSGTNVAGSGSLGVAQVTQAAGSSYTALATQTYNRTEAIQVYVADENGMTGYSSPIVMGGPASFSVTVPTYTVAAGAAFRVIVVARDSGGSQVLGYNGTVSLSSVQSGDTSTLTTGHLGLTSLTLSGGQAVTELQTYSKADALRILATDSSLSLSSFSSSFTVTAPSDTTDHYNVIVASEVTVGLPFSMQVGAVNASSASVTYALSKSLTVTSLLSGTSVAGSGSLGQSALTLQAGVSTATVSAQTYNRMETVEFIVTDESGRTGRAGPVRFSGPSSFVITVPTYTVPAGQGFGLVVVAKDKGGSQVAGYNSTVNLEAVQAGDTSAAAPGTLGLTSLSFSGGLGSTSGQSYSRGGGLRIKATDTALNVVSYSSSFTVAAPADLTDHYSVVVPTQVTVGLGFSMQIGAVNASSAPVSYALPKGLTVTAILNGTQVAGSGSLGQGAVTLAASASTATVAAQTYNRIETVRFQVSDENGRTGLSGPVYFAGPSSFSITVPSVSPAAGAAFSLVLVALDGAGRQVSGYNGTVSLSAVKAGDTSTAAPGFFGLTTLVFSGGLASTDAQTYSRGDAIRIRALDTALNVGSYSSFFTVTAPADTTHHYIVTVPTQATVGLTFPMQVASVNASSAGVAYSLAKNLTLQAFLSGTSIAGSGSLGQSALTLQASSSFTALSAQTYNKIETLQFKVTDENGLSGTSGPIFISGPSSFDLTVPTAPVAANSAFRIVLMARDSGGSLVTGYNGTVNLTAVTAGDTSTAAPGSLALASIQFSAGVASTDIESYSLGGAIRIKAIDTSLNVAAFSSSFTATAPTDGTHHYSVTVPTQVTVGLPFSMSVAALDASSAPVSYSLSKSLAIQPLLASSLVAGSGSMGQAVATLGAGVLQVAVSSQTYNRVETIRLQITDENGKTGLSGPIVFSGPTDFRVDVPTTFSVPAGENFSVKVTGIDGGGATVLGYNGTVNLSAVHASSNSVAAGGILGLASLTLVNGVGNLALQTYTKAESFRIKALDTGTGVYGYSGVMTVKAGPPASLTLAANPGSLIQGQTSALSAQVQDSFGNNVPGSTVTFSVTSGSGTLAQASSGLVSALASTASVSGSDGKAAAVFGLPSGLTSAQTNVVRAVDGGLQASATIFVSVLISSAGGVVVQSEDPRTIVTIPANAYPFDVSLEIKDKVDVSTSIAALIAAAYAKNTGQFFKNFAKQISVFKSGTDTDAGTGFALQTLQFPLELTGSTQATVSSLRSQGFISQPYASGPFYRVQGTLVPASILRIYKLNQAQELWEQVIEGQVADVAGQVIKAQVKTLGGVYTIGAAPYQDVPPTQTATLMNALGNGASVQVDVPLGCFSGTARVSVTPLASGSLPAANSNEASLTATGLGLSIDAGGQQPLHPIKISISFTAAQTQGFDPTLWRLARYDASTGLWVLLETQLDAASGRIIGFTPHLSTFQVMQLSPQATLSSAVFYPNPFRPSKGHTSVTFGQLAAGADIKVFTLTGRLLRSLEADSTGTRTWDVTDDHGSGLPSGVYFAVIKNGDEKKVLKFAVQK